jgi:pyruvate/2-oxoglutarate dehydrogenase complex dihydrolipoamide dehydrogenase (E3) component
MGMPPLPAALVGASGRRAERRRRRSQCPSIEERRRVPRPTGVTSRRGGAVIEQAEVIVVGLGPGGEDAAGRLAEAGLDVVAVEAELVGGECPYWGCVPSKMMLRAADLVAEARRVEGMAGACEVRPDWAPVASRIRGEATDSWDDAVAASRLEGKGARLVRGWGRLDGPGRVVVGDIELEASRAVVVNIGTRSWAPPIDGLADVPYWTNREAIEATEVPATLAVIGGGAIGVELGQVFCRFGADVTILEAGPRLVGPEEPEAGELLATVLRREGIDAVTSAKIESVRHGAGGFVIAVAGREPLVVERLLVATGRRSDLRGLGAATIGVDEAAHSLPVDDHLRVCGAERTWAIGDVTGKGAFTHVSMYQADIVVQDVLGRPVVPADYRALPRVTFTDPELGSVGLSEADARAHGLSVRTGTAPVPTSTRGWIHKAGNDGFVKLVEDVDRGVLVGATSMGPWGGEVLGLLALAVHAEVPTVHLAHMIYAYPTFHRVIEAAVKDLVRAS